ncbi:unnamed protein product [Lampetra fluviatilis]
MSSARSCPCGRCRSQGLILTGYRGTRSPLVRAVAGRSNPGGPGFVARCATFGVTAAPRRHRQGALLPQGLRDTPRQTRLNLAPSPSLPRRFNPKPHPAPRSACPLLVRIPSAHGVIIPDYCAPKGEENAHASSVGTGRRNLLRRSRGEQGGHHNSEVHSGGHGRCFCRPPGGGSGGTSARGEARHKCTWHKRGHWDP